MRSSVACLPQGTLMSLSLTPDLVLVRAGVLYGKPVDLDGGAFAHWIFWRIRRMTTRERQVFWSARPFSAPAPEAQPLALRILDGGDELTAHQFKGLATALGIWAALRKPPMLERAGIFNLQATAESRAARMDEVMARDCHFGLSERAAASGWNVGP